MKAGYVLSVALGVSPLRVASVGLINHGPSASTERGHTGVEIADAATRRSSNKQGKGLQQNRRTLQAVDLSSCTGYIPYIGDGRCFHGNNNAQCDYDGGDCCECDCQSGDWQCGAVAGFTCHDPESACYVGSTPAPAAPTGTSPCELFDCGAGYTNKVGYCSLSGGERNLAVEFPDDDGLRSDDEYSVTDDDWVPGDDDVNPTTCTLEICCQSGTPSPSTPSPTPAPTTPSPTPAPLETPSPTTPTPTSSPTTPSPTPSPMTPSPTPSPMTPSPTPSPTTPSPTPSPMTPSPTGQTCSNGLPGIDANGVVCCPLACGQCGGKGCSSSGSAANLGRESCCGSGVKESGVYCDESGSAPCIIGQRPETPSPTPTPTPERTPAPTPEQTPAPTPEPTPEPGTCSNGLPGIDANGVVCCPLACGQCGGKGCSSSGSAAGLGWESCCGGGVKSSGVLCSESGSAPCIIDEDTGPTCSNGLQGVDGNGIVCCSASCGTCGGSGCSSRPGGSSSCCGGVIKSSGIQCSESGSAPCII